GGLFRGVGLSNVQGEVLNGASFQIPKRSPSAFADHRAIPLLALPCTNEEQPCSLETRRRVDESELEHLAAQLAALGEFTQEACCSLVELRDAVTKVNLGGNDGQTLRFGAARKLVDFPLVQEKLPGTQWLVVPRATR